MTQIQFPPPSVAAPQLAPVIPITPEVPPFDTHAIAWAEKGWEVLPMSPGGKVLLAKGITGYSGERFTLDEIRQAVAGDLSYSRPNHPDGPDFVHPWQPNRNLGLRMPPGVIGIDVDAYDAKQGTATLAELEDKAGSRLPATWVLTARDDRSSGIRLYRVPPDTKLADQTDIEMIQRHHRYALAAGSLHKTGRLYRLLRSDTWADAPVIPHVDELPILPTPWVKLLKAKDQTREFGGVVVQPDEHVQKWLVDHAAGIGWQQADAVRAYDTAWGDYGSRNTSVFVALAHGMRAARDGKASSVDVVSWISERHYQACAADGLRSGRNDEEVSRAVSRIVSKFLAEQITLTPAVAPPSELIAAVDVGNPQSAARWLWDELGARKLSGFFLKDGQLVQCIRFGEDGFQQLSNGHQEFQQVKPVRTDDLLGELTRHYTFGRMDRGEPKPVLFPREVAGLVATTSHESPNLKTLRGATTAPVVRLDGSILDGAGYDESTGLLYEPGAGMDQVRVSVAPTAEEMTEARWWVDEVIGGFPFTSADDRVNYVTMLLTPFLRIALPGPRKLFVMDARQPGTGKTLLAKVAHMIHGGVMRGPLPTEEPELVKDITTLLLNTSSPIVTFDNVEGMVKSTALTSLLTSTRYTGRILGSNTQVDQLNDRVWSITGNNVTIGGDFARRCIWVDIDAGIPSPQSRTGFKHNLHQFVPQNRPRIVWALLTMIRGWQAAGAPSVDVQGSDDYAEWIRVCDSICKFAGYDGTVGGGSRQSTLSADDEEWSLFLEALHDAFADRSFTAKEIIAASQPYGNTGVVVPENVLPGPILDRRSNAAAAARSLGWWLKKRDGRIAGRYQVVRNGQDGTTKQARWQVRMH
jgi:hypothetical protein